MLEELERRNHSIFTIIMSSDESSTKIIFEIQVRNSSSKEGRAGSVFVFVSFVDLFILPSPAGHLVYQIFSTCCECHSDQSRRVNMEDVKECEFSESEIEIIQKGYERLKDFVYFDSAGAAVYSEDLIRSASDVLIKQLHCNPHTSKTTGDLVEQVRYR